MATRLTGTGIQYDEVTFNQYSEAVTSVTQTDVNGIIKMVFGSATTVNQSTSGGSGTNGTVDGTTCDMGVPTKSTNWYRIYFQTCSDDNDGSISGNGFKCQRWTPSSGWTDILRQGEHSSYDNNYADWYRTNHVIFWAPVHQTYPTEQHQFRIGWHKHDSGAIRINSSIGNDLRRNGWNNNAFEVWEVDSAIITTTGTLSRY
jgi:hypothetical protein